MMRFLIFFCLSVFPFKVGWSAGPGNVFDFDLPVNLRTGDEVHSEYTAQFFENNQKCWLGVCIYSEYNCIVNIYLGSELSYEIVSGESLITTLPIRKDIPALCLYDLDSNENYYIHKNKVDSNTYLIYVNGMSFSENEGSKLSILLRLK